MISLVRDIEESLVHLYNAVQFNGFIHIYEKLFQNSPKIKLPEMAAK